jgi:hypothetical protein
MSYLYQAIYAPWLVQELEVRGFAPVETYTNESNGTVYLFHPEATPTIQALKAKSRREQLARHKRTRRA